MKLHPAKKKNPLSSHLAEETLDLSCSPLIDAAGLLRLSIQSRTGEIPANDAFPLKNVSEIRLSKDGAIEIKFFDRASLLSSLYALSASQPSDDNPLLNAIRHAAGALHPGGEGREV